MVPGVYAVSIAYAGTRWPAGSMGRAMASIVTGNVVGGFLGRALSGLVADQAGWRASFLAIGALTLVGAAAICRLLPVEGSPAPVCHLGARVHLGRLLDSRLFAIFAVGFNVLFMQVAAFTYVTFHLAEPPFRLGTAAMSSIFAVYLIGAVVTPFAGRWIGRIGARRVLLLALGGGTLGALLTLLPLLVAVVLGLALLATAAFVGQSAATSHLSAVVAPEIRSIASGVYLSSYYIGGAVGGVLPAMAWHLGRWPACVALILAFELMTLGLAARYFTRKSGSKPVARDWPPASPSRCA
jgi:predicted MFS family arabinose efflux permease